GSGHRLYPDPVITIHFAQGRLDAAPHRSSGDEAAVRRAGITAATLDIDATILPREITPVTVRPDTAGDQAALIRDCNRPDDRPEALRPRP
ncbi:MAG: hypothetical protein OXC91_06065, partial [Rhodobacteraceae bacterium]|nr:hypothetical protein [Paracoccaceae bacterium]